MAMFDCWRVGLSPVRGSQAVESSPADPVKIGYLSCPARINKQKHVGERVLFGNLTS